MKKINPVFSRHFNFPARGKIQKARALSHPLAFEGEIFKKGRDLPLSFLFKGGALSFPESGERDPRHFEWRPLFFGAGRGGGDGRDVKGKTIGDHS